MEPWRARHKIGRMNAILKTHTTASAAVIAAALAAGPAQAHHTPCKWGMNVVVSMAEPSVSSGPPLAMWGCHGPVVWATVVGADGSRTFVPVYGVPTEPKPQPQSSSVPEDRSTPSRSRAKKTKSKCKRRAKRSSRKKVKRCAVRSKRRAKRR